MEYRLFAGDLLARDREKAKLMYVPVPHLPQVKRSRNGEKNSIV